ncbi:MAG: hypothetical protein V6D39_06730 [Dolichospermum lemmermannii FEM_B0920]
MNTIQEIIIKVPSNIAEAYRRSTKEEQEQIQLKLALIMESNLLKNSKVSSDPRLLEEVGDLVVQ